MTTFAGTRRRCSAPSSAIHHRLVFTWSISPQTIVNTRLAETCTAAHIEIQTPAPGTVNSVVARLMIDGHERQLSSVGDAAWTRDDALVHLDIPGMLHATARSTPENPHVLYARTPLLGELGIRGGRYDFDGAELR